MVDVEAKQLTAWLSRLVQIPSVNPVQAGPKAGLPGEAKMAEAVAQWFTEFGAEVEMQEVYPNRHNVYGLWRGSTDRWLAVDIHTDTVGVEQMTGDPFSGRVADGRVYGRGAVDTKASLAVVLALLEAVQQQEMDLEPNLLIAATVNEESGAQAAPVFAEWVRRREIPLDELIVAEPTRCSPVYGHKGGVRYRVSVKGAPSHSAQPHLGKNAITAAARLITALGAEDQRLQALPPTPLGTPTLTVTLIEGGAGPNVVPDNCQFTIDRRMVDGETAPPIAGHLAELAAQHCPLPVEMKQLDHLTPFLQTPDTAWIRRLSEWSGQAPDIVPFGTNAWAYGNLPGECVVLGPGSIDQAHRSEEWVAISELEKLADIYQKWWGLSLW